MMGMPTKHKISLQLATGREVDLELPPPSRFPSTYFVFMRDGGAQWVWPLVRAVLNTAGQPLCDHQALLRDLDCSESDVHIASLNKLFQCEGYAFGIVWNPAALPVELDTLGRKTFLFVRDPREVLAVLRHRFAAGSMPEFLRSRSVADFAAHCRQLADFCRARRHVTIVRLEDLTRGWTRLVDELREALTLSLSPDAAVRIARSVACVPQKILESPYRRQFGPDDRAEVEHVFAATLAFFGYPTERAPTPVFLDHWSEFERAMADRLAPAGAPAAGTRVASGGTPAVAPPAQPNPAVAESDPELLWRPKANARSYRIVLGRRVTQEVDAYGCRPVLGQPPAGAETLAAYGCSITYGNAVPFEETFCSVLQGMLPRWRIENHGCGGYSMAQNLIQLRRDSRWSPADYVTFCFHPDHLLRNVAAIEYRRKNMANAPGSIAIPPRPYPRAALARDGSLEIRHVRHPRWDLDGIDLSDFRHDEYYLDLVGAAIFERAAEIVRQSGGHFFVTTLMGDVSPVLRRRLDAADIPVLNSSIEGREYTCLPDDAHPNALAHRWYAERLRDYLLSRETSAIASTPACA